MEKCQYREDDKCTLTGGMCNNYFDCEECMYATIYENGYKEGFFDGENGRISRYDNND